MKRASSFMEYVIIIGLVSIALTAMNIYIKRGLQARVKDMTNYFLSPSQEADSNPGVTTTSVSNSVYSSSQDLRLSPGGGLNVTVSDAATVSALSSSVDSNIPYNDNTFVPAPTGLMNGTE